MQWSDMAAPPPDPFSNTPYFLQDRRAPFNVVAKRLSGAVTCQHVDPSRSATRSRSISTSRRCAFCTSGSAINDESA